MSDTHDKYHSIYTAAFFETSGSADPTVAFPSYSFAAQAPLSAAANRFEAGGALQFTPLSHGLLRVRQVTGEGNHPSLNERVGLVIPGSSRPGNESGPTAKTSSYNPMGWDLLSPSGTALAKFTFTPSARGGYALSATAGQHDGWYGMGFHRQKMELHGLQMRWERKYRSTGATVPFFFSTAGYGVFSNNPWSQTFDFAAPDHWALRSDKATFDLFLIYGPSPKEILDGYPRLCGRPNMPPRWALDSLYICRYYEDQAGVESIATTFRERDIPYGMLGLEPGWEERPYSMRWRWSESCFQSPKTMIERLHAQGYHFELWESGVAPGSGFIDPVVRDAWFQARVSQSLDLGVDFFKQDDPYPRGIMSEEMQAPVETKPDLINALDAEAANIANSLYSQTVVQQIEKRRGHRGIMLFTSYWATVGAHRWQTAWASDFVAGTCFINGSLSAHSMVCSDMEADNAAGIHLGYLTPFALIDSWAGYLEPWLFPPYVEEFHRFYAKLRIRLGPHLYSAAWASHTSGLSMMRPMLLEHPEDSKREISIRNTILVKGFWWGGPSEPISPL